MSDRFRAGRCSLGGNRAPRHQDREYHGDRFRGRQGTRLRTGQNGADPRAIAATTHCRSRRDSDVFGTAAYMSPEQAEGRSVDARSDIFSTGAVLYEMFTGSRAFEGDSTLGVLSRVLHDTPPAFVNCVRKCRKRSNGSSAGPWKRIRNAFCVRDRTRRRLADCLPAGARRPHRPRPWHSDCGGADCLRVACPDGCITATGGHAGSATRHSPDPNPDCQRQRVGGFRSDAHRAAIRCRRSSAKAILVGGVDCGESGEHAGGRDGFVSAVWRGACPGDRLGKRRLPNVPMSAYFMWMRVEKAGFEAVEFATFGGVLLGKNIPLPRAGGVPAGMVSVPSGPFVDRTG